MFQTCSASLIVQRIHHVRLARHGAVAIPAVRYMDWQKYGRRHLHRLAAASFAPLATLMIVACPWSSLLHIRPRPPLPLRHHPLRLPGLSPRQSLVLAQTATEFVDTDDVT